MTNIVTGKTVWFEVYIEDDGSWWLSVSSWGLLPSWL